MEEVNNEKHLTRRVPSVTELQKMVEEAATLPPTITY